MSANAGLITVETYVQEAKTIENDQTGPSLAPQISFNLYIYIYAHVK